jgi:hypothetical protein
MLAGLRSAGIFGALQPVSAPDVNVVAVATYAASSTASTHNVTLPSYSVGDLLVMVLRAGTTTTATRPDGWDVAASRSSTGDSYIWYRTATGSEGSTLSVSLSSSIRMSAVTYSVSGVTQGIEAAFTGSNTNNPPSITASWGSDRNLFIAVLTNRRSDSTVTAAPTNYGSLQSAAPASNTGTSRTRVSTATRILTAASDDPGAFTTSGTIDTPHSATIVIR